MSSGKPKPTLYRIVRNLHQSLIDYSKLSALLPSMITCLCPGSTLRPPQLVDWWFARVCIILMLQKLRNLPCSTVLRSLVDAPDVCFAPRSQRSPSSVDCAPSPSGLGALARCRGAEPKDGVLRPWDFGISTRNIPQLDNSQV